MHESRLQKATRESHREQTVSHYYKLTFAICSNVRYSASQLKRNDPEKHWQLLLHLLMLSFNAEGIFKKKNHHQLPLKE